MSLQALPWATACRAERAAGCAPVQRCGMQGAPWRIAARAGKAA
jgi:hypothetical protein